MNSHSSNNFVVSSYVPNMEVSMNKTIRSTDALNITVDLPEDATGKVIVNIDGANYIAPIINGVSKFSISGLNGGKHSVNITYPGDHKYSGVSKIVDVTVDSDYVILKADNLVKYYGGSERLIVKLYTSSGKALSNQIIHVYINGVNYTRTTNSEGILSMAINLNLGEYNAIITYNNKSSKYNPVSTIANVSVLHTICADDLVKTYHNDSQYWAYFTDSQGKALTNTTVKFNINGVYYTRVTNANGWARLNINLNPGKFILTAYNPVTGEERSNDVAVLSSIKGYDLVKVQGNGSQYQVYFTDFKGNALVNTAVRFNINGVYYTRVTNATGWAILNINLSPGEYILTAYNPVTGEQSSNKITVLSRITENHDIVKKYLNATQFTARIIDDDGSPVGEGKEVTFNINGVIYQRYTNSTGHVKLNINLNTGIYTITTSYQGCMASNTVVVLP